MLAAQMIAVPNAALGSYRHGRFTCKAIAERRQLSTWIRMMRQLAQELE